MRVSGTDCESNGSHEVLDLNSSVVTVLVDLEATQTLIGSFCEGVCNKTITGLEADLGLEGVLANCTYHLKGYIWAVEETCVVRRGALVTDNVVLLSSNVCSIRIDVDSVLTKQNTSEGVTSVINVQVSVECRGVVEYASHGQCRCNVGGTHEYIALSSTSSLCDCVSIGSIWNRDP